MNETADLSPRQREICELVGRDGHQWQTVARILEISEHTVRSHVDRLMARIGSDRSPREALTQYYWKHLHDLDRAS